MFFFNFQDVSSYHEHHVGNQDFFYFLRQITVCGMSFFVILSQKKQKIVSQKKKKKKKSDPLPKKMD